MARKASGWRGAGKKFEAARWAAYLAVLTMVVDRGLPLMVENPLSPVPGNGIADQLIASGALRYLAGLIAAMALTLAARSFFIARDDVAGIPDDIPLPERKPIPGKTRLPPSDPPRAPLPRMRRPDKPFPEKSRGR